MNAPNPPLNYSIYANPTTDEAGLRCAALNVDTEHYAVVIVLTAEEVCQLQQKEPGVWEDRQSLRLGRCHQSGVFWSADSNVLSILIGHDDESWSVSLMLPIAVLAEIRKELKGLTPWLAELSLSKGYLGHVPADYEHLTEE
jgi:hypothetical protein